MGGDGENFTSIRPTPSADKARVAVVSPGLAARAFPFFDHLTLAEVAVVERWRGFRTDEAISRACNGFPADKTLDSAITASRIGRDRISSYLLRNPRSLGDAA